MHQVIERLLELARRKDRFTFDLRGNCQVYNGIVCAYASTSNSTGMLELPAVVAKAMEQDGIVGAWQKGGKTYYDSCRIFTHQEQALRFARAQGQRSIFNLNREEEIPVDPDEAQAA